MRLHPSTFLRSGSFTVLVVLPRHLVRADFSGQPPALRQLWQSDAPMGESLPVLADAAFALGPTRKASVYVFATACWTGVLPLSSAKASTLSATELCQALGFEAETLSNISPFDSLLAATPLAGKSGDRLFWVTQVSRSELGAVEDTLLRRGARLAGFAHPGGLPRALSEHPGASWSRSELWGDSAVCIDRSDSIGLRLQVLSAFGGHGDWLNEAEAWFATQGIAPPHERLIAPGVPFGKAELAAHDLNDAKGLADWLTAWACEISRKTPGNPVLRAPPRPMSSERRFSLSAGWTALAVLFCVAHGYWLKHTETSLQQELARVQEPVKRLEATKSRARASALRLAEAREQLLVAQQQQSDWEHVTRLERRRHAVLLHALADLASDDFVVQAVGESAGETHISILAMRPELPDFTDRLGAAMAPLNWHVEPPNRQALNLTPDGGPWQLNWTIHEINSAR